MGIFLFHQLLFNDIGFVLAIVFMGISLMPLTLFSTGSLFKAYIYECTSILLVRFAYPWIVRELRYFRR